MTQPEPAADAREENVKGRRIDATGDGYLPKLQQRGDYGKDDDGMWWAICPAPGCPMAALSDHQVTEHEDGTITVSPSLLWPGKYHGYLERGIWREV